MGAPRDWTALKNKLSGISTPTTTSASSAVTPTSAWPLFATTKASYRTLYDQSRNQPSPADPPATLSAAEMRKLLEVRRERLERELSAVLAAEQDLKVEGADRMLDSLRKANLI